MRCIPNSNKHSGSVLPAEEPAVPGGGGPGPGVGQGTTNSYLFFSVVDPNTLNLDPDLGFRPNLDPDPRLCYAFLKKKLKLILEKTIFLTKMYFLRTKCHNY